MPTPKVPMTTPSTDLDGTVLRNGKYLDKSAVIARTKKANEAKTKLYIANNRKSKRIFEKNLQRGIHKSA